MIFGVAATLFVLVICSVLRLFLTRLHDRPFRQVIPYLRPEGAGILQEVMDAVLEKSLLLNLSRKQLRQEQLDRMRLVDEYIGHRTHNAVVWQGWGDTELRRARKVFNREVEMAADELVVACAEFRIGASVVQIHLHFWQFKMILLPFTRVPHVSRLRKADDFDLLESYEKIKRAALKLAEACGGNCLEQLQNALHLQN